MDEFLTVFGPAWFLSIEEIICSLLLTFVLASAISYVYRRTHESFNAARGFMQTLVLGAIVSCVMIMAIGNNLARGLGILGTLAIIRFRTPIRDPRDIIFLFAALAIGIACGAGVYTVAIIGSIAFCLAVVYLHVAPFTSRRDLEGLLRFAIAANSPHADAVRRTMEECCTQFELIAMREASQGEVLEYSYHVRLVDPSNRTDLLEGIRPNVEDVHLVLNRITVEL